VQHKPLALLYKETNKVVPVFIELSTIHEDIWSSSGVYPSFFISALDGAKRVV
jgi:hypothetical protein